MRSSRRQENSPVPGWNRRPGTRNPLPPVHPAFTLKGTCRFREAQALPVSTDPPHDHNPPSRKLWTASALTALWAEWAHVWPIRDVQSSE
jgi:hypothetical protein